MTPRPGFEGACSLRIRLPFRCGEGIDQKPFLFGIQNNRHRSFVQLIRFRTPESDWDVTGEILAAISATRTIVGQRAAGV